MKLPATAPLPLRLLSDDDLAQLDQAACHVLEHVGVAMPSARAREALQGAGALVQGEKVTIPAAVLRGLLALAPPHLTLGARAAVTLTTGSGSLLTTDGCCVEIYDLETGSRRPTEGEDVAAISRLVDAMPQVDFCWPAVSAQDYPVARRGLWELYLSIANTGKHVQTVTVVDPDLARVAVDMAVAVAGGADALRKAPPVSALLGTVTPLGNDGGTLETGLIFAEAGVPIGFVSMPMGGSTTPVTMAGSLVVAIAETLSAVAAVQAAVPGAPVFLCFIPSIMDLKTGDFTGGAPEDTLMGAAAADVGRFYRLPTQCGVNASGAKMPGWQAAIDDVSTTLLSVLTGVDMIAGVGMVAGGRAFSCEEMALAAEVTAVARDLACGSNGVERPAASATPIAEAAAGGGDAAELARAYVRSLLETHRPPPLDAALDAELRRLAEGAPA